MTKQEKMTAAENSGNRTPKRLGPLASLIAGSTLALGSQGVMVHDWMYNIEGDGWEPANGVVSKVIGVERGYKNRFDHRVGWERTTLFPKIKERDPFGYHRMTSEVEGIKRYVSVVDYPLMEMASGLLLASAGYARRKKLQEE